MTPSPNYEKMPHAPPEAQKKKRRHGDAVSPLMVTAQMAARMFSVSLRTWRMLDSAGKIPKPTRLGGRVLWRLAELRRWGAAGCPDRVTWQQRLDQKDKAEKNQKK